MPNLCSDDLGRSLLFSSGAAAGACFTQQKKTQLREKTPKNVAYPDVVNQNHVAKVIHSYEINNLE